MTTKAEAEHLASLISVANLQLTQAVSDCLSHLDDPSQREDLAAGLRIILRHTVEKTEFFENLAATLKGAK